MAYKRYKASRKNTKPSSKVSVGLKYGFRSGLEEKVAQELTELDIDYSYESMKIKYVKPLTNHTYTPDFILPNGIIIETKGRLVTSDRKKHLLIQEQHPEYDIRFVFSNCNSRLSKLSKTTYAMWCTKNNFKYAHRSIPIEWIEEAPCLKDR